MRKYINYILQALLWVLATLLIFPITIWNLIEVKRVFKTTKGYFLYTAKSIDQWGNREFRTLWNTRFITADSKHHFGNIEETISSVLGKNKVDNTLTKLGKLLCNILDFVDRNHCIKSIDNDITHNIKDFKTKYKK